jgi:hypothetical protein
VKLGAGATKGRYHIQADINMIPLIDVALVLLVSGSQRQTKNTKTK